MLFSPISNSGYRLFHEGIQALSQVEANGIRIDTEYLGRAKAECKAKIAELKDALLADEVYTKWRRRFGPDTNLGSREQLGEIVFKVMKYPCREWTEKTKDLENEEDRRPSTTDEVLRNIKLPFLQNYLRIEKHKKALNTYLRGIEREVCDGYIHPFFNLHTVISFRSSADHPNSQNILRRNEDFAKLVRTAFIPRSPNRQIVEFDFKGVEVSVSACYNHDPVLIKYVTDSKTDMHRDMAEECFILKRRDLTAQDDSKEEKRRAKGPRDITKNKFVFPEFYGNWYKAVAKDLWKAMLEFNLRTADGTPLKEHLRKHGIKRLGDCGEREDPEPGTFEHHIKEVEEDFWGRRFKVYSQWKRDWNDSYLEKGYFDTLTGFRCSAMMDRKQCVNFPIQGSAFHCLLWSLIRVQKLLRKYNMKSLIIGQIHDSMIMDVLVREMKDVMEIVKQVTMVDLAKHWSWICVPLRIEAEASPPGKSWYEKHEVSLT
jgi:DNA polymerase-1